MVTTRKRLLIIGPSFRRKVSNQPLPAIELYDGLFFRIAKKYANRKKIDIVVMLDDLTLVNSSTRISYIPPEGKVWKSQRFAKQLIDSSKAKNKTFIGKKIQKNQYSEIFLAMGKSYSEALPEISAFGVPVSSSSGRGIGPKAAALATWIKID